MQESFGARMRRQREEHAVALTAIAQQTKIKLSLLEALERDDVSHWPAGIFRRAFIRAYAHAIGLNPDEAVREFLEVHPDPAELVEVASILEARASHMRAHDAPPTRIREIVESALKSLSSLSRPWHRRAGEPGSSNGHVPNGTPAAGPFPHEPDFVAVANVCTRFGLVESPSDLPPLVEEISRLLDAVGLIVWVWNERSDTLQPALVHGYSDHVIRHIPPVHRDDDNATAAAFRSAHTCVIHSRDRTSSALVVPMLTPAGCAGVLATELPSGAERMKSVRAAAMIFAAQLAARIAAA